MDWEPYTGRKIVCVRDDWTDLDGPEARPVRGQEYTIRGVDKVSPGDFPCLYLVEIVNPVLEFEGGWFEMSFDQRAFRPLDARQTSIECFEKLLEPTKRADEMPVRLDPLTARAVRSGFAPAPLPFPMHHLRPQEAHALFNHEATLDELAASGGLTAPEILAILEGRSADPTQRPAEAFHKLADFLRAARARKWNLT